MSSISGRHNGRAVYFNVAIVSAGANPNDDGYNVFSDPARALIDTGATETSISPQTVRRLRLSPNGKRDVITANGVRRTRFYDFQIAILSGPDDTPFFVLPVVISGSELNTDKVGFDILLGMDVISQGDLIIRRDGTFTFEF